MTTYKTKRLESFRKKFVEGSWIADFIDGKPIYAEDIEAFLSETIDQVEKQVREELSYYCSHKRECIISDWTAGRPTKDGGYEEKIRGKWYQSKPVDKTPKCDCGLSELLNSQPRGEGK